MDLLDLGDPKERRDRPDPEAQQDQWDLPDLLECLGLQENQESLVTEVFREPMV